MRILPQCQGSHLYGRGCGSFFVTLFKGWKSTQNCQSSFTFFGTITTGEAQGLLDGSMSPAHCISCRALSTATRLARGRCLGLI